MAINCLDISVISDDRLTTATLLDLLENKCQARV